MQDDGEVHLSVALAEIAGAAFTPDATTQDLVLALDFSSSAFEPTGRDVDGDGVTGVWSPWQPTAGSDALLASPLERTTDPDDSVAGAELTAARTLLERLDATTTRVGLVSFGSNVQPLLPLSDPAAARARLETAPLGAQLGGTNVAAALAKAAGTLGAAPVRGARRSIVLLTDGFPNLPPPQQRAEDLVADETERLARAGIRVHVLAIVAEFRDVRPVLEELARLTGGSFQRVDDPTELPVWLAHTPLSGVERVEVRNLTTGAEGLAVRLLPDGRFDAFVALVAGENVIEVQSFAGGLASLPLRRTLRYAPPPAGAPPTAESARLLETLNERRLELELLAELKAKRREQRRQLQIEPARE